MNETLNGLEDTAIVVLRVDTLSPNSDRSRPVDSPAEPPPDSTASSGVAAASAAPTATVVATPVLLTAPATNVRTAVRIPDTLEVLTSKSNFWSNALSIEHDRLMDWQRRLGYPVVVVSALTGLAAFSQLESNPAWWATLTVAIAAFAAAALAAIQTQGNFAARAATAAEYSAKYGALFGDMLRAGDQLQKGGEPKEAELNGLYEKYKELKSARPTVSTRVRDQAHGTVEKEASSIRWHAEARSR